MHKQSFLILAGLIVTGLSACSSTGQPAPKPSSQASGQPSAQPSAGIALDFATKACNQTLSVRQTAPEPVQTWIDATTLRIEAKANANCAVTIKTGRYELAGDTIRLFYTPGACGVSGAPSCVRCQCDHPVTYTLRNLPKRSYTVSLSADPAQ